MPEPPLDAPDEEWLVWADAMQQIGDPRGELIALGHPTAFVREHAETLFGRTLGRHIRKGDIAVTRWRHCHADELELRITAAAQGPQLVVDAVAAPCAHRLRSLSVAGVVSPDGPVLDLGVTLGWLRESVLPPSLTSLALVDDRARTSERLVSRGYEPGPNLVDFGPLFPLWHAFSEHLEHVKLVVADPGQIRFQYLRLPRLQSFTLEALCWVEGLAQLLGNAHWPALRSLSLRCCDSFLANHPSDAFAYRTVYRDDLAGEGVATGERIANDWRRQLAPLFSRLDAVPLERLALCSFDDADSMLDALDDLALPTLVELDLSDSAVDARHVERLANHPLLRQLRRLVLERVRLPSPKGLVGVGPEVVHSCRTTAPAYRYVVGME